MASLKPLLLCGLVALASCTSSKYDSDRSDVSLAMEVSTPHCYNGEPFTAGLEIQGPEDGYSLCAVLQAGGAKVTINGTSLPLTGEWIKLPARKVVLTITPEKEGELLLNFQARSTAGELLSNRATLRRMVLAGAAVSSEIVYESRVLNPGAETRIPLHITTTKPGYEGDYDVSMVLTTGQGALYHNGFIVNGTTFRIGKQAVVYYHPKVLGDHLLDFTVSAAGESAVVTVYMDVCNNLVVHHDAPCGLKISGTGEHNDQDREVALKIVNDEGFNFQVAGWYDSQQNLLTTEAEYRQKMTVGSVTDVTLKLQRRDVPLFKNGEREESLRYVEQVNGKPVVKYCYQVLSSLSADFRLSDTLVFYYERAQYNMSTIPPSPQRKFVTMNFMPGENWLGYFYKISGDFTIYLRKSDNPSFEFNGLNRYVERGPTRYYIAEPIVIQQ